MAVSGSKLKQVEAIGSKWHQKGASGSMVNLIALTGFLQHPYDSTGADYKSKGRLAWVFDCIRKIQGWLLVGAWTNEEQGKSGGKSSAASLHTVYTVHSVHKQWGQSSRTTSTVGIAVGDDGNEVLAQATALQFGTFWQTSCSKKQNMEG